MKIYAIIPARSGSSLVDKNIMIYPPNDTLSGVPIIVHSIRSSLQSKSIHKTFVSTDSETYRTIASNAGALVPFLRPSNISSELSSDFEFLNHFCDYLKENDDMPDLIIQLRPTSPTRTTQQIEQALDFFKQKQIYDNYDSLRSVVRTTKCVYKTYTIENHILKPIFAKYENICEPYNQARQHFPTQYIHNGFIDIIKPYTITNVKSSSGNKIYPWIMSQQDDLDIDTKDDFNRV